MQKRNTFLPLALCLIPTLLAAGEKTAPPLPPATTQPTQVITPAVAPEVIDRVNVTTAGDFLWWNSYLGGMEYAVSGIYDDAATTDFSVERGKVKKPPFGWGPGIKLTLGVDYRLDAWNTTATYTGLFTDKEKTSVHYDAEKGLASNFPVLFLPFQPGVAASIESDCSWRQKFNVLDIELARNFFISKTLTLRPHAGLKLSWIEEKFDVNYLINPSAPIGTATTNAHYEMWQKQWGIGIRGGLDAVWHIVKNFGVYGEVAATTLWSSYRTHINEVVTSVEGLEEVFGPGTPTVLDTDGRIFEVIPVLELGLGFEYANWFHNDTCLFFARAGWEAQVWSNFNQFVLPLDRLHGNLSLHGLTIKLGFTF